MATPDGEMSVEWDNGYYEGAVYLDDEDVEAMVLDSRNAQAAGTKDSDQARNSEAGKAKLDKTSRDQSRVGAGVRCTRSSGLPVDSEGLAGSSSGRVIVG